jgi:hypothetical protein
MAYPTCDKGVIGHFMTPDEALAAARRVRDSQYSHFDVLTPFPVHGMDEAMGLRRSWVPLVTLVLVVAGILVAQGLMNYVMVYDWPMNFGGKPFWAWPSFIPITFELMVLFGAIGTAIVAVWAGKRDTVPQPPAMRIETGATVDRFVIWIAASDPKFEAEEVKGFVESLGACGVRYVDGEEGSDA